MSPPTAHRLPSVTLATVVALALGCHAASPPPAASKSRSSIPAEASAGTTTKSPGLEGDVTVQGQGAMKGRLVLGWRTASEQREIDQGIFNFTTTRKMLERWTVAEEIDFTKTPRFHYRIEGAPADGTAVVLLDVDHTFWPTLFGSGRGALGSSKPGGGAIALSAKSSHGGNQDREPCAGPRLKLVEIESPGLPSSTRSGRADGAGPARRRFCAWLPKSWEATPARRYPVIFLLPGLMSTEMSYLGSKDDAGHRLDAIAAETEREAVVVGVDTSTPTGSTYLEDSAINGPFETFMTKQAIPELERQLHLIPKRTARALAGQSTGGYNTLSFGLRHSELFSVLGASSPDAPDVESWLLEPGTRRAREWIRRWALLEDAVGGPGQVTSWASDWSPNPDPSARKRVKMPFDLTTGAADEEVLGQWVAKSPHGLLRDPQVVKRLVRDLSGRILISAGRNDEFELFPPAERFAKELDSLKIETKFVPTDHGHGNGLDRIETAMRFALERLDRATR